MEPLYPQNILERIFLHFRKMQERAEKEARLFPSIDKTELEGLDVYESGGEAGLYSAFPYESGPIGKNLSTFA